MFLNLTLLTVGTKDAEKGNMENLVSLLVRMQHQKDTVVVLAGTARTDLCALTSISVNATKLRQAGHVLKDVMCASRQVALRHIPLRMDTQMR